MSTIVISLLAGLLGTGVMSLFMSYITTTGIANADMIRAVGSLYSRTYENALRPGLIIHFASGAIIAIIYALFISLFHPMTLLSYVVVALAFSTLHGLVVSFLLVVLVAQYHPLERFQKAGSEVASAHFVGHVIYGIVVGLVLGITKTHFTI